MISPSLAIHPDSTLQVDDHSTQAGPEQITRRDWLAAWAVALLAGLLRVMISDRRGFWLDEYYTLRAAQMNLGDLVRDRLGAGHSPLYFLYARLGFLFGSEEWMLRLTSVLALSAAILLINRPARRAQAPPQSCRLSGSWRSCILIGSPWGRSIAT